MPVFFKNLDAYLCHHLRLCNKERLPAEYSRRGINTLANASGLTNKTIINYQVGVWVHSTEPFRFCHKRKICFFAKAYPKHLVRAPVLTASIEVTSLFIAASSYCAGRGPSCVACYQQELRWDLMPKFATPCRTDKTQKDPSSQNYVFIQMAKGSK